MQKIGKEENADRDNEARAVRNDKKDFEEIDKVLNQMQLTYKANIEAQETYIDILKCKTKNINSKYIKMIYALFTENKANQICFQKEQQLLGAFEFEDRLIRRYYARVIEMGIRKISYFWANNSHLEFLSPYVVKIAKQIQNLFNEIYKAKTLDQHFSVLSLLYHENAVIEQKIYELLIKEGYILSMDQFYRINGVDLVSDRFYEAKPSKMSTPNCPNSEELIESKGESQKNIRANRMRMQKSKQSKESRQSRKQWAYSKMTSDQTFYNQTQSEKNRMKIKTMLESIVKELKTSFEQQKQGNNLDIIEEENDASFKQQVENTVSLPDEEEQVKISVNKAKRRLPKPEIQCKRKVNEKKISIELMSYFCNQLKSVISQVQEVDIDCLSDLLMTSESNSKPMEKVLMKINQNQSSYIHSLKSLDSLKKIKQQKKRAKLIEMALKKRNFDSISQMYDEVNENCQLSIKGPNSVKQKFSFRSAPGLYINLPQKQRQSHMKASQKSDKKQDPAYKKLIIRQHASKDHIFQNELIVNELTIHQLPCFGKRVNITEGNDNNLTIGISSSQLLTKLGQLALNQFPPASSKRQRPQQKKIESMEWGQQNAGKTKAVLGVLRLNKTQQSRKLPQNDNQAGQARDPRLEKAVNQLNYVIYDRVRRRIVLAR